MLTVGFRGLRHLATNMFEEVQIIARCRFRWRVGPSVMMVMKPDEDAQHDGHGDQLGGRLSCLAHPTQKPRGRLKRPTQRLGILQEKLHPVVGNPGSRLRPSPDRMAVPWEASSWKRTSKAICSVASMSMMWPQTSLLEQDPAPRRNPRWPRWQSMFVYHGQKTSPKKAAPETPDNGADKDTDPRADPDWSCDDGDSQGQGQTGPHACEKGNFRGGDQGQQPHEMHTATDPEIKVIQPRTRRRRRQVEPRQNEVPVGHYEAFRPGSVDKMKDPSLLLKVDDPMLT